MHGTVNIKSEIKLLSLQFHIRHNAIFILGSEFDFFGFPK